MSTAKASFLPCHRPLTLDDPETHSAPPRGGRLDRIKPKKVAESVFQRRMAQVRDLNDIRGKCVDVLMLEHQIRQVKQEAGKKKAAAQVAAVVAPPAGGGAAKPAARWAWWRRA